MTPGRTLAVAMVAIAASVVSAHAQMLPWPGSQPQPGAAPWPTNAPPAAPAPGPGGPPMGSPMGPPQMNAAQQECLRQFTEYRQEVEKRAMTAKAAGEKRVTREEMCKLVTLYSEAEAKWLKYSSDNMARCGIPKDAVDQIRGVHTRTADARKKLCAAGPTAGAPAAPSLSDALGTTRLPSRETEQQRKPGGGTLDTLTGTAIR